MTRVLIHTVDGDLAELWNYGLGPMPAIGTRIYRETIDGVARYFEEAPEPAPEFQELLDPAVDWYRDPAFDEAFDEIENQENTMNALTNSVDPVSGATTAFPAYINIRFEGGRAIVSMRGDPVLVPNDDNNTEYFKAAKVVEATFEQTDWDQFVAEATRERGLVPGG